MIIQLKIHSADETVLVVEDNVLLRTAIADYLRSCGYRAIGAANAEEAVDVLERGSVQVDIAISGVEMRGPMNGFMLRRWVMDNYPDVDVMLASTPARAVDTANELCEAGPRPAGHIPPQAVLDRIKRMLAARKLSRKSA